MKLKLLSYTFGFLSCSISSSFYALDANVSLIESNEQGLRFSELKMHPVGNQNLDSVLLFHKLELGIELPNSILEKVQRFINKDPQGEQLNPFLSWSLRVQTTFVHESGLTKTIDAFYFEDYKRNQRSGYWDQVRFPYVFLCRFAAPLVGNWKAEAVILVDNKRVFNSEILTFNVLKSEHPGYVSVHPNKLNLQRGGNLFYPLGQNLGWPGLNAYPAERPGLKIWQNFHNLVKQYHDLGGVCARILLNPEAMDIEWEALGDYSQRMDYAWEMDRLFEYVDEQDMLIHLNFMVHTQFNEVDGLGNLAWDFSDYWPEAIAYPQPEKYVPYCYRSQLGLKKAYQLFSDSTALVYQKERMRYLISRYCYTPNIYLLEMASETNSLGTTGEYYYPDYAKQPGYFQIINGNSPYKDRDDEHDQIISSSEHLTRSAVYTYHREMTTYIKNDLQHSEHLTSVNYTGNSILLPDQSYSLPSVDVMTFNAYNQSPNKLVVSTPMKESGRNTFAKSISEIRSKHGQKPIVLSETGGGDYVEHCWNDPKYLNQVDVMTTPFTGIAGMNTWQGISPASPKAWHNVIAAFRFLNDSLASVLDIDSGYWKQNLQKAKSELLEHQYYLSQDQRACVGYLYNRTFNSYSMGKQENPACRLITSNGIEKELSKHQQLQWTARTNKLRILGLLKNKHYVITYYGIDGMVRSSAFRTYWFFGFYRLKHPPLDNVLWYLVRMID